MTQLSLPGPLICEDLGTGRWRLVGVAGAEDAAAATEDTEVYLRVARPGVSEMLMEAPILRLDLQWHAAGVTLTISGCRGMRRLEVDSAVVHQPKSELYDVLSLASFDSRARRFWQRVFALMRIPGGRFFLNLIARRRG